VRLGNHGCCLHIHTGNLSGAIDLNTILPSLILYGVWHKKEGSVGGRILRIGRAIVKQ